VVRTDLGMYNNMTASRLNTTQCRWHSISKLLVAVF